MRASRFLGRRGSLAVDQPRYPEAVDDHAKTLGPERLLEWQHHLAVPGQFVKDTHGLTRALDLEREREALWLLIAIRRDVPSHQQLPAGGQSAVHHLVLPVGRNLSCHRRPGITEYRSELAAETLLVELERRLALSLETQ